MEEEKAKKEAEIESLNRKMGNVEQQLSKKSLDLNKQSADYKKLEEMAFQLEREKNALIQKANSSDIDLTETRNKLRMLEKENKAFKRENNGLLNDKDRIAREKMEAVHEKNLTKGGVNALTREIEYLRKQVEMENGNIMSLVSDKNMMAKKIIKAEEDNVKNKDNMIKQQNEINQLTE